MMFKNLKFIALVVILNFLLVGCNGIKEDKPNSQTTNNATAVEVDSSLFVNGVTITPIPCTLSDGTKTDCYQIVTKTAPSDHQMGPWCPENISDGVEEGGIWLEDGEVYDVDGDFIKNMATFYKDTKWQMYDDNGTIHVTKTEQECIDAANPNVGEEYENFCVECLPSYITDVSQTFVIPVKPVLQEEVVLFLSGRRGPRPEENGKPRGERKPSGKEERGGSQGAGPPRSNVPSTRGIALNGVEFSAPAPTDNILSAYTLAPFDDAGGHINVHQGYHYHAATGISTKVPQADGHAAQIGYALDGHAIYELEDADGILPQDLDELRGHSDKIRGYHYHVDEAGSNNFINGLKGAYVN